MFKLLRIQPAYIHYWVCEILVYPGASQKSTLIVGKWLSLSNMGGHCCHRDWMGALGRQSSRIAGRETEAGEVRGGRKASRSVRD